MNIILLFAKFCFVLFPALSLSIIVSIIVILWLWLLLKASKQTHKK